ncbi:YceI family protein [Sphingomonas sp. GM_Shp_2]|uniref:YceI family protein n=1 Tax=Sphingomonas sp. GM_Shp_2 TaxID=2937380 RepID=UPI00226AA469|nr:YceI family protein [Sphingomonas sp. GM_Shp_2]
MRLILAAALAASLASTPAIAQTLPGAPVASRVTAGTYPVDAAHTQVTWQVNHMGFTMLEGQFGASDGTLTIDPARPAATTVDVTFKIDDLSVTSAAFAKHLKSADFFDVANHPTARFVSTSVKPSGNTAVITGNLTIKGITKPVTLNATFIGAGANPMSKKLNIGFRATGSIKRSDYGLGMAVPVVSDKVDLTINAAFAAQ